MTLPNHRVTARESGIKGDFASKLKWVLLRQVRYPWPLHRPEAQWRTG